jgi:hypothetical protein
MISDTELGYCKFAYEKFKQKGDYEDLGNVIYDILKPYIPFNSKLKRELWEVAFWQEKAELKKAEMIEQYKSLRYEDASVIVKTKQIALKRFFQMLLEMDIQIEDYIKQKYEETND